MDIKAIIRKKKIDNLLGKTSSSEEEKKLLSFLDNCFDVFITDKWYTKDSKTVYIYFKDVQELWHGEYLSELLDIYNRTTGNKIIKDYFEYRFDVKVKTIL